MRAEKLGEILRVIDPRFMKTENFDEYYVNCAVSRGLDQINRIKYQLEQCKDNPQKMLFIGHRGSGKSTELMRLVEELDGRFFIVMFSVYSELDPNSLVYTDLIFEAMHQLYKKAVDQNLGIKDDLLEAIYKWLSAIEIQETTIKGGEINVEAGISGGISANVINLLAALQGRIKYSRETKDTITRVLDQRFSELAGYCNRLIDEVKSRSGNKPILIIIEDLDKIGLDKAENIFCKHAIQLTALGCHMVFTFPVALRYSHVFAPIANSFDKHDLPMIKITDEGKKAITQIIEKRINPNLFSEGVLDKAIEKSGGALRELMRILQQSVLFAMEAGDHVITESALKRGLSEAKKDFKDLLTEKKDDKIIIKVEEYYAKLAEVRKQKKNPKQDQVLMDLLHSLSVLQYDNGERWYDLHPLVSEILDEYNKANQPA